MTGTQFVLLRGRQSLETQDLCEEADLFARDYYAESIYFDDYSEIFANDYPTIYHVEDSWENYAKISDKISAAYSRWKAKQPQA